MTHKKIVPDFKEKTQSMRKHFSFAYIKGGNGNCFHIKVSHALSRHYLYQEIALCKEGEHRRVSESFVTWKKILAFRLQILYNIPFNKLSPPMNSLPNKSLLN